MAYNTVEQIIKAAIGDAFKVYENIPPDYIQQAVYFYNQSEPFIWRRWPWHDRKVDEISATPDANGIIVFDGDNSDVDMVRAVSAVASDGDSQGIVWNEDAIRSAINGDSIGSGRFDHLSHDDNGNRRIRVCVDDGVTTYKVLAFRRFVQAEVNSSYDEGNPSATPYDYRVLTWKIDRAYAPLVAFISNELKKWKGGEGTGDWIHGLNGLIRDIREQEAKEYRITPEEGMFAETGEF